VQVVAQRGIHGVLKDVRELGSDLRETRKFVTGGRSAQRVRRNVQAFEVFVPRSNFLQHPDILAQVLQVLGCFLKE
jgi:hypothetical protein